jgi:hypothetical protein
LGESGVAPTSAMMFIDYSKSPECNKFIRNTLLYRREKRKENIEQMMIDKEGRM